MSLIVSQTPDIQEQIQQLLERLRELQDLQVTVEVRFITLTEEFYERIGIDFDIELNDKQTRFDRMVASNTFAAPGMLNEPDHLDNVIVGLTNVGNFTSDLDIPINSSSFNLATPPFGGFPNSPGANGGLDMGVAFLSSIEVYLFMEAAQGDRRSNVMTAPKITLFNGQTASLTSSTEQFFVVNVIPITNPFTGFTTFLPINQPFPTQVSLTVQAVVTADRRYVQLTLNPFITRTRAGGTFQPVPGITLQQPTIDILTVGTTVSVPDGGTILMGGLKTMSEGRNEFGPPILSKIPYINRLFRNSGYGREATSLMIMVTPRIIIPEEEEERLGQTFAF
jgi:general secretion pathway protein D